MKRFAFLPLAVVALVACASPDPDARTDAAVLPSGAAFRPVALALEVRCGSLDCHGSKYRNLRLFGRGGARLDPHHLPDAPETTDAEVAVDFDGVVALEPDVTAAVAADHGQAPERLTFVRKARGDEAHKGGGRIELGDDADRCVLSWLAGAVDAAACRRAAP